STCPPTSCKLICIYVSKTYRPGAASSGGLALLPSSPGTDFVLTDRAIIHSLQCGHQLPACFSAFSRQAPASGAVDSQAKIRFRVAGRIDQALNMAAVGKHKGAARAVELGRVVAALPRCDVVIEASDDIAVDGNLRHVERLAAQREPAG